MIKDLNEVIVCDIDLMFKQKIEEKG